MINYLNTKRFIIDASPHIINIVLWIDLTCSDLLLKEQAKVSLGCRGILNTECDVSPPGRNKEVIPDDAITRRIYFSNQHLDIKVFHR